MFIAKYPDGKVITEQDMYWDEVPGGMHRMELTLPIPVSYIDPETKETKSAPARTVSLGGMKEYYFYNEAVASMGKKGQLIAKAIGGIDSEGNVIEIRIDAGGFTEVRTFKKEQLAQSAIKPGA
jgi:hypothetical protein